MTKRSCVKSIVLITVLLLVAGGAGVLIWQFLPEESKESIQDVLNSTLGGDGNTPDVGLPNEPTDPEEEDQGFVFIQCKDDSSTCCNGLDSICDLRADEILYAGVHNAMAARENGFLIAPNHLLSLEKSLEAGYRAINVDFADCQDGFKLVHGRCALGSRNPTEVFTNIVDFLQKNPTEVIIFNMQIDNEASVANVQFADIDILMSAVTNFTDLMYAHPDPASPWPTLRELINSNKRILFFHYNGNSCEEETCPFGFHEWFKFAAETEFDFADTAAVRDTGTSCSITRGDPVNNNFFGVNMFVTLPSRTASEELNALESLREHMEACSNLNGGIDVNVVFVDFWSKGDLPQLVQVENAARAKAARRRNKRKLGS